MWVAHAPGMPGTFSPPPRISDPSMHHGTCITHVPWCMLGSLLRDLPWRRRRGKRMRNPRFYVYGMRPIATSVYWIRVQNSFGISGANWVSLHMASSPLEMSFRGDLFSRMELVPWFMAHSVLEIRMQIRQYGYTIHEFTTSRKLLWIAHKV